MIEKYDNKFKRPMVILQPGEFYACNDDRVLATVLGSCVAVCFKDLDSGISGMNHFMLPGDFSSMDVFTDQTGRYGMFAMEMLLGEMIKLGCRRDRLTAKVFGGGHVLNSAWRQDSVPENNIKFVKSFLSMEGIQVLKEDLGGFQGRKVFFFTASHTIYVKKMASDRNAEYIRQEEEYRKKLANKQEKTDLVLF